MPTWEVTRAEAGDNVQATDVETHHTAGESALNNVEVDAVSAGAFNHHHLPSVVIASGQVAQENVASPLAVTLMYPGWNQVAGWQRIDFAGGTAPPTTAVDANAAYMEFDLSSPVDLTSADIFGLEFAANMEVKRVDIHGTTLPFLYGCIMAVQAKDSLGTWHHIARSERVVNAEYDHNGSHPTSDDCWKDNAVHGIITEDDIAQTIVRLRLVVCREDLRASFVTNGVDITRASCCAWACQSTGS
jgi:hypothetical protein